MLGYISFLDPTRITNFYHYFSFNLISFLYFKVFFFFFFSFIPFYLLNYAHFFMATLNDLMGTSAWP